MLELAAFLEHLYPTLLEYDLIRAMPEPMMIKYFRKSLWPFILAELQFVKLEEESFV